MGFTTAPRKRPHVAAYIIRRVGLIRFGVENIHGGDDEGVPALECEVEVLHGLILFSVVWYAVSMALIDLTGKRYGRLIVIVRVANKPRGNLMDPTWLCVCKCGTTLEVSGQSLRSRNTSSCGCLRKELSHARGTHHLSRTKVYRCWASMVNRCTDQHNPAFARYSRLGICREFLTFEAFYAHIGDPPSSTSSIDRIDNSRGYFVGNVRWADRTTQSRNTSRNKMISANGFTRCVAEWAELLSVPRQRIEGRLRAGWTAEKALFYPLRYDL